MLEFYDFFLATHLYSIYGSAILMVIYLFLTQSNFRTEFSFVRKIRLFLPLYHTFIALMLFTGLLLLALRRFILNSSTLYMLVTWALLLFFAIVQYRNFKRARRSKHYKDFRISSFFIIIFKLFLLLFPLLYKINEA